MMHKPTLIKATIETGGHPTLCGTARSNHICLHFKVYRRHHPDGKEYSEYHCLIFNKTLKRKHGRAYPSKCTACLEAAKRRD